MLLRLRKLISYTAILTLLPSALSAAPPQGRMTDQTIVDEPRDAATDSGAPITRANVCNGIPTKEQVEARKKINSAYEPPPRYQYCDASRAGEDAADKNTGLAVAWGAVAVVCGMACFPISANGAWSTVLCQGLNIGTGIADTAITGEFTALMGSLGSTAMGLMMSSGGSAAAEAVPAAGEAAKETSGKWDTMSCTTALTSAGLCAMKSVSAVQSSDSASEALDNALKFAAEEQSAIGKGPNGSFSVSSDTSTSGAGGGQRTELGSTGGVNDSGNDATAGNCAGVTRSSGAQAQISCAMASDSNLPARLLRDPRFAGEFQKRAGMSLDQFAQNIQSDPKGAIGSAMAAGAPAPIQSALKATFDDHAGQMAMMTGGIGSMVGGRGRHGGSGGASGADPFAGALTGMLSKLLPQNAADAGTDPHAGVKKVAEANLKRGPAAVAEDKSLGIFDRISYRYYSLAYKGFGASK